MKQAKILYAALYEIMQEIYLSMDQLFEECEQSTDIHEQEKL